MDLNRRKFITTMAVAGAALPFTSNAAFRMQDPHKVKFPFYFFTKALDMFETDFMAETLAMVGGIDGLDVTVRPEGKVEPERVEDDLPKVVEIGKKYGLETKMMVTSFTSPEDLYFKKVLKTASSLGINHYRLGYYTYDNSADIWGFLHNLKKQFIDLVEMNKEYGIQAGYQNHAGGLKVGSPIWDLRELIHDLPVEYISSQFDIRHATVEGQSTWLLALRLLKDNIGSLAIKDFNWALKDGKSKSIGVPLGRGLIDFDAYFNTIKELKIEVPMTLHIEYSILNDSEKDLTLLQKQKIIVGRLKTEVDFVQSYLNKI